MIRVSGIYLRRGGSDKGERKGTERSRGGWSWVPGSSVVVTRLRKSSSVLNCKGQDVRVGEKAN